MDALTATNTRSRTITQAAGITTTTAQEAASAWEDQWRQEYEHGIRLGLPLLEEHGPDLDELILEHVADTLTVGEALAVLTRRDRWGRV